MNVISSTPVRLSAARKHSAGLFVRVEEMNHGSGFAAQSGSRLLSLYRFSSSIFSCKKEPGMEHPRALCGSVLTCNAGKASLAFKISEKMAVKKGWFLDQEETTLSCLNTSAFTFLSGEARTRQLR